MMRRSFRILLVCALAATWTAGCGRATVETRMNELAESYVKLVLAVGQHDSGYVDAYYGPAKWKTEAEGERRPLDEIRAAGESLLSDLKRVDVVGADAMVRLRYDYLTRQIESMIAYVGILGGVRMPFDEESQALYDAVAPTHPVSDFQATIAALDSLIPGPEPLAERLEAFRSRFVIPKDKLDVVFRAALEEGRRRTLAHIELPPDERFEIEYVTEKPWSGYNWYKGGGRSLIQVNTDLPIHISRAVDLACHEAYPGHHVYNVLLEHHLVKGRGWIEFCVYPLFSPQSLIAEGSANFGIDVAFPGSERVAFEKQVLFPLAGLDPATTEVYYEVQALLDRLDYAGNEAARQYLDGVLTRQETIDWLVENAMASRERAAQRVRFFDTYRSYVINYNLGKDLVRAYIERRGGTPDRPDERWREYSALISSPRLPSGLR